MTYGSTQSIRNRNGCNELRTYDSSIGNSFMLIDSHCHLSQLSENDLNLQIREAKNAGVDWLVAIGAGYGVDDNFRTLNIAKRFDNIVCALAMHPHDARLVDDALFDQLRELITNDPKVRAVGEIGLDYHYMHSPRDDQIKILRRFTELALEVKKPLVIHDRECGDECVDILREHKADAVGGVVHCFTGDIPLAEKYLDLGFLISFTGIITFKKADDLREVVKYVPLDRMMVETDSPFLAPIPFRGRPNQPAYVWHVAQAVAAIKGVSFEDVARVTTSNAVSFFDL